MYKNRNLKTKKLKQNKIHINKLKNLNEKIQNMIQIQLNIPLKKALIPMIKMNKFKMKILKMMKYVLKLIKLRII